jgi:transcriptional/translational regulatory protein YebC/TACO1
VIYITKSLQASIKSISAEITMIPQTTTKLTSEDDISKMEGLIDQLEEDDDVQNVWHNFDEN